MKYRVARTVGFLLTACLFVGACSFVLLDAEQLRCKLAAQMHLLNNDELTVIKVPAASFYSSMREISFNGRLYDVGSYEVEGDTVKVTVWHDEEEESVQSEMVNSVELSIQGADKDTSASFSSYHPFSPDGKILHELPLLSIFNVPVASAYTAGYSVPPSSPTFPDVIKPPPDKFA